MTMIQTTILGSLGLVILAVYVLHVLLQAALANPSWPFFGALAAMGLLLSLHLWSMLALCNLAAFLWRQSFIANVRDLKMFNAKFVRTVQRHFSVSVALLLQSAAGLAATLILESGAFGGSRPAAH